MAILALTSIALLLFQSNALAFSQNYTEIWPLSDKYPYIIRSEDFTAPDGSFTFARCAGGKVLPYYRTPLECNVTVLTAEIGNKKPHEVTCSLKVQLPESERRTSSADPVLRRFGDNVSLIWFETSESKEIVTVRLTKINMSDCTSTTSQGVTLPARFSSSDIYFNVPTILYDDGSFDVFVTGKTSSYEYDGRYKVNFDQNGVPTSGPIDFQSKFRLQWYVEVKPYGTPVKGYWFKGYYQSGLSGFKFQFVDKDTLTRNTLWEFETYLASQFNVRTSNAHDLYGFCWQNEPVYSPLNCTQFDASGNRKMLVSLRSKHNLDVYNLAEGGMLLINFDYSKFVDTPVVVRKIDVNGAIGRPLALDFTCVFGLVKLVNLVETTDDLSFHLTCREEDDYTNVPDRLKFGIRRTSKKYLDKMSF